MEGKYLVSGEERNREGIKGKYWRREILGEGKYLAR